MALVVEAQRRRRQVQLERERLLALIRTQNEELKRLDHEKDAFIASISHELRTPLTSIRGYTELVGDDATNLTEEQRHFLAVVDRNAGRLLRLVNDLLLAAQLDAVGELELELGDVDLSALANQAVESAGPAASMKNIELRLSDDHPIVVKADAVRIAQAIDNLLSNAIKFTPNDGRITVSLSSADGTARLEVVDTGMGMTPDEQSRLFERFYRTEGATDAAIQGSGLGLAISQAIAHAHGGAITVESEKGMGSTFALTIPLIDTDNGFATVPSGDDVIEQRR
jgi:signal transduction histidine kinase